MSKKPPKRELLSREGAITGWSADVHIMARTVRPDSRERATAIYLDIRGEFSAPVKGVGCFSLQVWPSERAGVGNAEIPSVGSFMKAKPVLQGFIVLSVLEFQSLLTLATSGQLRHCSCDFQEPHYGSALISSVLFSSEPPAAEPVTPPNQAGG